ncbi:MAG: helix-turn-helix domain-containing protein [Jatrophihabitantaceae bacterium]
MSLDVPALTPASQTAVSLAFQTPAGRPLRRDAAQNRQRLLAAAAQVFAEHGLVAGVDEVARAAGVGMGTLYRRFPTKQALIDELIGDLRLRLLELARAASGCGHGAGLEELLTEAGQLQADQPGCLQQLWNSSEAQPQAMTEFRQLVVSLLREGQRHGRIRPEATPGDITMVFFSIRSVIDATRTVAPAAWRRHLELLIAGLRPAGDPTSQSELTQKPLSQAQLRRIVGDSSRR